MELCRACGENGFASQDEHDKMDKLTDIYYNLTGMQLENVDSGRLLFCSGCIRDLFHFGRFRKKCLEVYQRLQDMKVEAWQEDCEPIAVKVELIEEPPAIPKEAPAAVATATNDKDKDKDKKKDTSSDEDDGKNDDDDDDDDDYDDGIGVGTGDDGDDGSEDEPETKQKSTKKVTKKRVRNRGDPSNSKGGRPRKHPKDPNKKPPKKFINCPQCPKKFFLEHRLEAHLRVHAGLKPLLCKICGKSFSFHRNLKTHHIQKHTDNKIRLPCDFPGCDSVFATKLGLQRHRVRYHDPTYVAPEIIPFICDLCGKAYKTNSELKTHRYIHTPDEMPFVCSVCGKKFPAKGKLDIHMKRHQGINNFSCPQCGLRKPSQSEVTQHIRKVHEKHLRTEKFVCTACNTLFSSNAALKRHVDVVHLKIKKFSCSVCGFMFSQKDHLKRHMKSHLTKDIRSLSTASELQLLD